MVLFLSARSYHLFPLVPGEKPTSDNIVFAYMIPFLYFVLSMGGASKLLGKFSLFGLRMELAVEGTGTGGKIYLLGAGMLMLTAGLIR